MEIRIKPFDTLFFRDGKPFTMGEETWADSNLLPSPSVIYGTLRTAIATQNDISFDTLADNTELGLNDFSVKNIFYRIDTLKGAVNVLPLPLDLVEYDKEDNIKEAEQKEKLYEVKPLDIKVFKSIASKSKAFLKYSAVAKDFEQVDGLENGLILISEFEKYLLSELSDNKTLAHKLTDFIESEPKLGIGREDLTRTSDDGSLYRTDLKRMKDFEIGVSFDSITYNEFSPLVRLGGEGKIVNISSKTGLPTRIARKPIVFHNNRFKIYFATPTILINGQPDLSRLGINAQLVAACIGKPLSIGGFNMKSGKAKPMYKVVPAGSVFYYESENEVSVLNSQQGTSLSEEQSEQGFGIAYFGTWKISTDNG